MVMQNLFLSILCFLCIPQRTLLIISDYSEYYYFPCSSTSLLCTHSSPGYPCSRPFYKNLNLKLGVVCLNCLLTSQKSILSELCWGGRAAAWPCSCFFQTITSRNTPEISPALSVFHISLSEFFIIHRDLIFCSGSHRMMVSSKRNWDFQHWSSWLYAQTRLVVTEGWLFVWWTVRH